MDNLAIWNSAEKTDPKYTKSFSRSGGFKGTAINGTYIVRRLTELFGPCGQGWRIIVEDEKYVEGAPLTETCNAIVHVLRGRLEYRVPEQEGTSFAVTADYGEKGAPTSRVTAPAVWVATGSQFGQTDFVYKNKNGVQTDEEAPKKSMTDLTSKLAVLVGIGADVHLGRYDDNKYVAELQQEFAAREAASSPINAEQASELAKLCAKAEVDASQIAERYGINSLLELPEAEYSFVANGLSLTILCKEKGRSVDALVAYYRTKNESIVSIFDFDDETFARAKAALEKPAKTDK